LSTLDRVKSDALVNRVTLVNILGPGTSNHKGWEVIHVLGERWLPSPPRGGSWLTLAELWLFSWGSAEAVRATPCLTC